MKNLTQTVIWILGFLLFGPAGRVLLAAAPKEAAKVVSADWQWDFNFIPNAFSRTPRLEMTVVSEMTAEGKKWPEPSAEHPLYFRAQAGQYRHFGDGPEDRRLPSPQLVELSLSRSLATAGYLPAMRPDQPVAVVIFYHWGSHTNLDRNFDTYTNHFRFSVQRAALVGGRDFSRRYAEALSQENRNAAFAAITGFDFSRLVPMAGPMYRFTDADARLEQLVAQASSELYYVVASAYSAAAMAQGRRELLWRTKMTADSRGVSMVETLPVLIGVAAPYLGRDVPKADALTMRFRRGGHVEFGEPRVLGFDMPKDETAKDAVKHPPAPQKK